MDPKQFLLDILSWDQRLRDLHKATWSPENQLYFYKRAVDAYEQQIQRFCKEFDTHLGKPEEIL